MNLLKFFKYYLVLALIICFVSCSTDKNAFLNRAYHSTTARYNGYFNANELINQSLSGYRKSYKEDYYSLIPIERNPNEKEIESLLPSLDTAIVKCKKVIQDHSMPSIRRSYKKVEYNTWIDENFVTIAIANYYKKDYDAALRNFEYVEKFYSNDESNYHAAIWEAKINIEEGFYTDAHLKLRSLDLIIANQKEEAEKKKSKKKKKRSKRSKKKSSKKKEPALFPKKLIPELEKTKALLYLKKKDFKKAIFHLEKTIEATRKRKEKARVHFVIGQLSEQEGAFNKASENYRLCLKYPAPFEMHFNARLRRAFSEGGEGIKKELRKMLKDSKNAPFLDQIYYALSASELKSGNENQAIIYLTKSAFFSTANKRQKSMAYEKLGDLSYGNKKYVPAQKYYDSCAKFMPENYPNGEAIKNKANKLDKLVKAVEIITFEDSVQMIAMMNEKERIDFLENVVEEIKKREAERKEMEAQKLLALQEIQQNNESQNAFSGNKWYFHNPKAKKEGLIDYRKMWGSRENEDDWRRSEKMPTINIIEGEEEEMDSIEETVEEVDSLNVEKLLKDIPLTQAAMDSSIENLLRACFDAAVIYKDQLNEIELASDLFNKIINKKLIHPLDLRSSFQLYKIKDKNRGYYIKHKNHILDNYPNSDYASYLINPDFYLKRQSLEKKARKKYLNLVDEYNSKNYSIVINTIENILANDTLLSYKGKYLLLKVTAKAQITKDKKSLIKDLNFIIEQCPDSDESSRAKEMIGIIEKGYSKNEPFLAKKRPYLNSENAEIYGLVILETKQKGDDAKIKVSSFNKNIFKKWKIKTTALVLDEKRDLLLLKKFKTVSKGKDYIAAFKKNKQYLSKYRSANIFLISKENLQILLKRKDTIEYEEFYDENY